MRPYRRFFVLLLLAFSVILASCRPHRVCSGLNPEIGKYNTKKRLNKGGRRLKSRPEKAAMKYRKKQLKHRKNATNKKVHHHIIRITVGA
jgi:hypothetical protein